MHLSLIELVCAAVEHGDAKEAADLLDSCGEVCRENIDILGPEGDTLLHIACLYAHEDCARLLLSRGASADVRDEDASTVLHDAAASGCVLGPQGHIFL
jgi:Ankyrin repeats (3 copies)